MAEDKIHGFPEGKHHAKVSQHVNNIPGRESHSVVPEPGETPAMKHYGPVTSGQKGTPGTD